MKTNSKEKKMRKRTCGIFAVAAALLITALVIGCVNPMNPSGLSAGNLNETPAAPPAMPGTFRINIDDTDARTLMPGSLVTIMSYNVHLTHTTDPGPGDIIVNNYIAGANINLVVGAEYTLRVEGMSEALGAGNVVAVGTHNANITTTTGTVTVYMQKVDSAGTGTFSWAITLPSGTNGVDIDTSDTATFTFVGLSPHALDTQIVGNLDPLALTTGTLTGNKTLNSGYYEITLTVVKDGGAHFDRVIEHRAIIYQGQTTPWEPIIIPDLVPRTFTVAFDVSEHANSNSPPTSLTPTWGTTITAPSPDPTHSDGNFSFNSWRTGSVMGFAWNFATLIRGDLTLHALWNDDTPSPVVIDAFNLTQYVLDTDPLAASAAPLANVSGYALYDPGVITLTRTVDIARYDSLDNILWFLDSSANNISSAVTSAGTTFTIEFNDPAISNLLVHGTTHHIILRATTTVGGNTMYWGIRIPVLITNN